jgi:putative oxidoreductase
MKNLMDLIARILISLVFLISGLRKIIYFDGTVDWMEGFGVPGFLLTPVIILEIIAPLMIIFGYKIKIAAVVLSIFCFATAIIFLNDFPNQIISFSKNLALAGGLIFLAINESGSLSIDKKFKK